MKPSSLEPLASFALLGPGFGDGRWRLFTDLRAGTSLTLLRYEDPPERAVGLDGTEHAVDALEPDEAPPLVHTLDAAGHREAVESVRAAIAAGDVYQVNVTLRARVRGASGSALLSRLCARGVPRFAAWLRLPDGSELVSASPELFFAIDGRHVRTEPMKGTAAPGGEAALLASDKDRAELAMITDVLRNDLVPICEPRTVRCTSERRLLRLPYAVQAVSDVEGRLLVGVGVREVLAALHPGGSITGAPRRAARDFIARLEPSRRGFYCGALAFTDGARTTASLLIRTATRTGDDTWEYGVGGGIVWDSDPGAELAEIRTKLGALG